MKFYISLFLIFILFSCGGQHANYPLGGDSVIVGSQVVASFSSIKANIFQNKCLKCHVKGEEAEDVPLDNLSLILRSSRELVVVGKPEESGLVAALKRTDSKQMPPPDSGITRLTQSEISVVEQWIREGAVP